MRKEYKLEGGRPNPYATRIGSDGRTALLERFLRSENYVRLDADVAEALRDEAAVNDALRLVLRAKALPTRTPGRAARKRAPQVRMTGHWRAATELAIRG